MMRRAGHMDYPKKWDYCYIADKHWFGWKIANLCLSFQRWENFSRREAWDRIWSRW
jgi:hypothetical protein